MPTIGGPGIGRLGGRRTTDTIDASTDVSLADQLWHLSPAYVTVVVDDIHLLPAGSAGWDLLNDLVLDLPENADAILSGRGFHELRIARLIARGEAIEITEEMLAFTDDELSDFARLRDVEPSSLDEHGWPALVELEAHAGVAGAHEFVAQEVLGELSAERVTALRRVALHDSIDDELVRTVTSFGGTSAELLEALPLTTRAPDGTWTLHDLWRTVLTDDIDPDERRGLARCGCADCCAGAATSARRSPRRSPPATTTRRSICSPTSHGISPSHCRSAIAAWSSTSCHRHSRTARRPSCCVPTSCSQRRRCAPRRRCRLAIDVATEQDRPEVTVLALLRLGDMAYRSGDTAGLEESRDGDSTVSNNSAARAPPPRSCSPNRGCCS